MIGGLLVVFDVSSVHSAIIFGGKMPDQERKWGKCMAVSEKSRNFATDLRM